MSLINKILNHPLKILFLRGFSYPYPYRVALIRLLATLFNNQKPHYLNILYETAILAKASGHNHIMALEFGVSKGDGLLSLEKHSRWVQRKTGVKISIYGFDMGDGVGLPPSTDYRDMLYLWSKGDYAMDEKALKKKLKGSQIITGNVSSTLAEFWKEQHPILGCVFVDLDYFTSTRAALESLKIQPEKILPRVLCYFDDLDGAKPYLGEWAAIEEFNKDNTSRKLLPSFGYHQHAIHGAFAEYTFMLHCFDHPKYSTKFL